MWISNEYNFRLWKKKPDKKRKDIEEVKESELNDSQELNHLKKIKLDYENIMRSKELKISLLEKQIEEKNELLESSKNIFGKSFFML